MDKMSLFSVLTVSVPEAIFNIYMAFLLTGEKTQLYLDDKKNIIKLCVAVPLMVISAVATRYILPNLLFILLANIAIFSSIFRLVYGFKWSKALVNVLIFYGFVVTIEIVYTPMFLHFLHITPSEFYASETIRLIYSLPIRALQIFVIISLWNWNRVVFNIKEYKETKNFFIGFFILVFAIEIIFLVIFVYNFESISPVFRSIFLLGLMLFSIFNYLLFRIIPTLTNVVLKKSLLEMIRYKQIVRNNYNELHNSLDNEDVEQAKKICNDLLLKL